MSTLLEVKDLAKNLTIYSGLFQRNIQHIVKPVSFSLKNGETIGFIGKNCSGKSTIARMLAGATKPTSGEIRVNGKLLKYKDYNVRCKLIRMIFQDPNTSLNPRAQVAHTLEIPLKRNTNIPKEGRIKRVNETLLQVGLLPEHSYFYPHMLATGQKQRVCLARALILRPSIIVADEALNGLDMAVRSQIINLFLELQKEAGISFVYISQHIGIIKHITDKIIVMNEGEVVETGDTQTVLCNPKNQITQRIVKSYFNKIPSY
ncbi:peptide ABC transporter ATP-binding protein [Candidatus Photodesmus blepharus]|uniref:Peptide ABC transporter ATP-binding protein n=1 Tax=Candidatus Photodesmus blepharonis TaxID=1179155 RepID=A0A084CN39_9GAMM|nr:ABC transporter ATP-binding protein [Candidatus Photodesmus blepharus]KEY91218.1 peptide ABC transporter ATP-binding protein [Candidatus Photodesmus blepharus]